MSLWTRRDALLVGAGAFGLTLPKMLRAELRSGATPAPRRPARAKSVVILYLSGGPSQLDMWDLKPQASEEIRGTFRPISTCVPGVRISEHLPRMARLADKYTIVRSMSHQESDHLRAGYWVMTGGRLTRPITAYSGMERSDRPHVGSIAAKFRPAEGLPSYVVVPEFVSPRGIARPGQHAGFLGAGYDPYAIQSDPSRPDFNPGPLGQANTVSVARMRRRRDLLQSLEHFSSAWHETTAAQDVEAARASAFDLVASTQARQAFDLSRESAATRARYGDHAFGQSALVARRLVEAGVRLVQVNFPRHDNRPEGQGYDSHSSPPNPPHLTYAKDHLLPKTDTAFASLIEDLSDRGLLDETLVVMMGEFGRTPQFNQHGGRDHWPGCYSLVVAGGGTLAGGVYGASDKFAAVPTRDPVSPDDLLATIYYLLGIDPHEQLHDMDNRPLRVVDGRPVMGLIS
jgi:hypothetical protein